MDNYLSCFSFCRCTPLSTLTTLTERIEAEEQDNARLIPHNKELNVNMRAGQYFAANRLSLTCTQQHGISGFIAQRQEQWKDKTVHFVLIPL